MNRFTVCRTTCLVLALVLQAIPSLQAASALKVGPAPKAEPSMEVAPWMEAAPVPAAPSIAPAPSPTGAAPQGYYRYPALHGDTLVFAAEGDLWRVSADGGEATRLTSHPREESNPAISPDGRWLAFSASYEGPTEVYIMPIEGGLPKRLTWQGTWASVVGWTPDGKILYATDAFSTLPEEQLVRLDPRSGRRAPLPLAQASDGDFSRDGSTLFFTRLGFQGSHTKRYKGGTAQNLWRYPDGDKEATPLTADYEGTSKSPMWWNGRVYFLSDRDGTMNLWSMDERGGDLKQLTHHSGWDIGTASLSDGRIAYSLGADLWIYDIRAHTNRRLSITLSSDLDQMRELWIRRPIDYLTAVALSPKGDKVVLTARGQVFVAPTRKKGRLVEATRNAGVRYRNARFMPDDKTVLALSDESGEVEFWTLPSNGIGKPAQLTTDGTVLRWEGVPSPDGRWIAHHDKNQNLWLFDIDKKTEKKIDSSVYGGFGDLKWSPDSRWLVYGTSGANQLSRLYLYNLETGRKVPLTSDRYDSYSPAWTPDGAWIYFLSDRSFRSMVGGPWGPRQPDPFVPEQTLIYALSLKKTFRSPFQPPDELADEQAEKKAPEKTEPAKTEPEKKQPEKKEPEKKEPEKKEPVPKEPQKTVPDKTKPQKKEPDKTTPEKKEPKKKVPEKTAGFPGSGAGTGQDAKTPESPSPASAGGPKPIEIDLDGIAERLVQVPVTPGNYGNLTTDGHRLFWLAVPTAYDAHRDLKTIAIDPDKSDMKTILPDVRTYTLSDDTKKLLVMKGEDFFVFDAGESAPGNLGDSHIDLSGWAFSVDPREQWRQMFDEAWRLERDYFYDPGLHGVDWKVMRAKYRPLVNRVTTRSELNDVLAQMVSELSALHTFVVGGDARDAPDRVEVASLGAQLERDEAKGGYRVDRIYHTDTDDPAGEGPFLKPGVGVAEGDIIQAIDGVDILSAPDPGELLRNRTGRQVRLKVADHTTGQSRDVIVTPVSPWTAADLRYDDWELSRRQRVEEEGDGQIGYVHLRAMVGGTYDEWMRDFYPVFNRQGLIIDVRNNGGGNTDSWILGKLLRKAWFYWKDRVNEPTWNMPYAFRGHIVVLVNEGTASDGEAFAEGIKRLELGKVIGTRTWGGEIWLSFSNDLVDRGIASAAETGVYGPEGQWLIEGHGVDPDIVVDDLPHETYYGQDAQLDAAVRYLQEAIRKEPIPPLTPPKFPNKAFRYPRNDAYPFTAPPPAPAPAAP